MISKALRRLLLVLLFCIPLQSLQAEGRAYAPKEIPNVQLQDSLRRISDPEGYLSPEEAGRINQALRKLSHRYGIEPAIVLIPSIGERDIEGYATELLRLWGLGNKQRNDGLLLLIAIEQRRMRWEVGYGLEGVMTDAASGDIWRNEMSHYFRDGAYAEGLEAGLRAVERRLEASEIRSDGSRFIPEEPTDWTGLLTYYLALGGIFSIALLYNLYSYFRGVRTPQQARARHSTLLGEYDSTIALLLLFCLPIGVVLWLMRSHYLGRIERLLHTCPRCGNEGIQPLSEAALKARLTPYQLTEAQLGSRTYTLYRCSHCASEELVGVTNPKTPYKPCPNCQSLALQTQPPRVVGRTSRGEQIVRITRHCLACSHTEQDDHKQNDNDDLLNAAIIGTILSLGRRGGSSSGGWGGGGGFSGGGWGGGSSGGGGYSGRW